MAKVTKTEEIKPLTAEEIEEEKTKYTRKIFFPIYEPKGDKPKISELYNTKKRDQLISEIEKNKDLDPELKEFLKSAAERHTSFNFSKIAEFYSHLPIGLKKYFEDSALVIIDYDNAIRNGFIAYDKEVQKSRIDYLENIITAEKMAQNKHEVNQKRLKKAQEELNYLINNPENDFDEW